MLGNAIEEAQHRKKTTAPASAPLAAPEKPTLRSRPAANSAPPVGPSAPPPSAPPPPAPPAWAPPASAPASSRAAVWAAVAAVAAVVVVVVAIIAAVVAGHHSEPTATPGNLTATPSGADSDSPTAQAPTPTTPTFASPPLLLQGADRDGDTQCDGGFCLPRGYPKRALNMPTSSDKFTSCAFAIVVGQSYLATNPDPDITADNDSRLRTIPAREWPDVQSSNPNIQCSGNAFLMQCQEEGADQWITCRGGNDAIVYIY